MAHTMSWSQVLADVSGGLCDVSNRQAVIERMVAFAAAGFRVPAQEPAVMEGKG